MKNSSNAICTFYNDCHNCLNVNDCRNCGYGKLLYRSYQKGREDAEREYKAKLIALIDNSKFIAKYGDMIYAMDLALDFGLLEEVEEEFNR